MSEIKENIALVLDASGIKANSLSGLIAELKSVQTHIESVNAALNGMNFTGPARTAKELEAALLKIKNLDTGKGSNLKMAPLAKALGADEAQLKNFERFVARQKTAVDGYVKSQQAFRNLPTFTRAWAKFEKQTSLSIGDLLKGGPVKGGTVSAGSIKVDGQIGLVIPDTQVNASVSGPVTLTIAGDQVRGAATGGNNTPGTGQFTEGNTAGKKRKSKKGGGGAAMVIPDDATEGEIRRVITQEGDAIRETVTRINEVGNLVSQTWDNIEQAVIKTVTRKTTGATPLATVRALRAAEAESFKQAKAGLTNDPHGFGLAGLQAKQAAQLRSVLPRNPDKPEWRSELETSLGPVAAAAMRSRLEETATTLEAQSAATRFAAEQSRQGEINAQMRNVLKGHFQGMVGVDQPGHTGFRFKGDKVIGYVPQLAASVMAAQMQERWAQVPPNAAGAREDMRPRYGVPAVRGNYGMGAFGADGGRGGGRTGGRGPWGNYIDVDSEPVAPSGGGKSPKLKSTWMDRMGKVAGNAFGLEGFASHVIKGAGWMAAISVPLKSMQLLEYSMSRVLDVGKNLAHLEMIFRGVGGSARQLTNDVMALAAANGRSTDEGIESAAEWARLGLTRVQVNEAVRASLMAANVGNLSVADSTKQLIALTHIYHLSISQLAPMLGVLTATSQRWNASLPEIFAGLDRSAGAARAAGMGLPETQGILAGIIGKTGTGGAVAGNALKYFLTEYSRDSVQEQLRSRFGIETTTAAGAMKPGGENIRNTFLAYEGMDNSQRRALTTVLGGRFQNTRFTAMMDSYLDSQKLSIDAQLNLNAAQLANAKILDTLQAKLTGLKATWDQFVFAQTNAKSALLLGRSPLEVASGAVGGLSHQMQILNAAGISLTTPTLVGGGVGSLLGLIAGGRVGHPWIGAGIGGGIGSAVAGGTASAFAELGWNSGKHWWQGWATDKTDNLTKQFLPNAMEAKINALGTSADVALGRSNLFKTTAALMALKNPDDHAKQTIQDAIQITASEMPKTIGENFSKAALNGNMSRAGKILAGQIQEQSGKNRYDAQEQFVLANQGAVLLRMRQHHLQEAITANPNNTGAAEELAEVTEAYNKLNEVATRNKSIMDEIDGSVPEAVERRQAYVNVLREQSDLMDAINQLGSQQTMDTWGSKLDAQLQSAGANIKQLQSDYDRLNSLGKDPTNPDAGEAAQAAAATLERLKDARAQQDSLSSPALRAAVEMYDNRNIVARRAGLETAAAGYGYTETEKLLNQKKFLTEEIGKTRNNPNAGEDDLVRAKKLQIELGNVQQSLDERRVILLGQQHQILVDSNREFQKSLLFAGPGELLKKLFVGSVASRRTPSAGEFMSWDESARQTYYQMRGGDAGAKNREEMGLLNRNGYGNVSPAQQSRDSQANRGAVKNWGDQIPLLPPLGALEKQAMATATSVGLLGGKALDVVSALTRLEMKLNAIAGGGANPAPTPRKSFDVSTGHALGSHTPQPVSVQDRVAAQPNVMAQAVDSFLPNWLTKF